MPFSSFCLYVLGSVAAFWAAVGVGWAIAAASGYHPVGIAAGATAGFVVGGIGYGFCLGKTTGSM